MKTLSNICLSIFFGMPYAILAIVIVSCLKPDNFFYWVAVIMLFVGVICLLLSAILLPSRKDKREENE